MDQGFTRHPFEALGDTALERAGSLGATYADFRFQRDCTQSISTRDRNLESLSNRESVGYGVRVIHAGAWGYAAGIDLTPDGAAAVAAQAIQVAKAFAGLNSEPVELADEDSYTDTYISPCQQDPFEVDDAAKISFLLDINETILGTGKAQHARSHVHQVKENKYFASLAGSRITQQRIRVGADITATRIDSGNFDEMSATPPPASAGWEHIEGLRLKEQAAEIPGLLDEKMKSPSVEAGHYDLVIHPSNLWLTIHESIGHSTELDRVLGYEATMAGTSFAKLENLGTLKFGSPVMNVTGDRTAPGGMSTVGYDDEGVAAQQWHIIKDGLLVAYQLNRQMARRQGLGRSNGCAFSDSYSNVPIQRMPNVCLNASPKDISLNDLLAGVDRGIYIVGDRSWSIDQQRYNFQFTGQRFYEIRNGKLGGQLKDVVYQGTTTEFWNSMEAVGGPETYILCGTFSCGKGEPGQAAPASHGCPAGLFRGVNVLNATQQAGS